MRDTMFPPWRLGMEPSLDKTSFLGRAAKSIGAAPDCISAMRIPLLPIHQARPGAGPGTVFLSCDNYDNSPRIFRA